MFLTGDNKPSCNGSNTY